MTIFGASHADSVGVVLEGVPIGLRLVDEDFTMDLNRRKPQGV